MTLRRLTWTLAFIMASTGCGKSGTRGCSDFWGCEADEEPFGPVDWGPEPDFGPRDAGAPDMPVVIPPRCTTGDECTAARGCNSAAAFCLESAAFGDTTGGPSDPILNHPDGEDTPIFIGGYCTTSFPEPGLTPSQCNVRGEAEPDPVCTACATCIDIFGADTPDDPADFVPGMCLRNCTPSLDSNECRDGYECLLTQEVCFIGCTSDAECRVSREDNNGVPGIQRPIDCEGDAAACTPDDCGEASPADPEACADPGTNFDNLVYDTTSEATCNAASRCEGAPSDPTASGGDPCTDDSQCEAEGTCIEEASDGSWAGGSCTKYRCDLEGNECANDGVCQESGVGVFACLQGCSVGGFDTDSDPSTWVVEGAAQAGCREGYACYWGGTAGGGVADNGACLPIEYSDAMTAPNTGASCTEDSDCFSPFGNGFCITEDRFPEGYCSVRNCAAPWFTEGTPEDQNVCGDGALCVGFDDVDPTFALCVQECTSADECGAGLGCVDVTVDSKACWAGCAGDTDCRSGERCAMAGTGDSACVPE